MDFYVVMLQEHAVNWIRRLVYGFLHAEEQPGGDEVAFELLAFVRGGDHVEQVPGQRQRRVDVDADAADRGGARDADGRGSSTPGGPPSSARSALATILAAPLARRTEAMALSMGRSSAGVRANSSPTAILRHAARSCGCAALARISSRSDSCDRIAPLLSS